MPRYPPIQSADPRNHGWLWGKKSQMTFNPNAIPSFNLITTRHQPTLVSKSLFAARYPQLAPVSSQRLSVCGKPCNAAYLTIWCVRSVFLCKWTSSKRVRSARASKPKKAREMLSLSEKAKDYSLLFMVFWGVLEPIPCRYRGTTVSY